MRRTLVTLVLACGCSGDEVPSEIEREVETPTQAPAQVTERPTAKLKPEPSAALESGSLADRGSPYTPAMVEEAGGFRVRTGIGGVEIFSLRGDPPPLNLSAEAKGYLTKYGGWLTWKPDAPGGGQWGWEPGMTECGVFLQHDQVADIAVVLAGVDMEARCRLCANRVSGHWVSGECSCAALVELDRLYTETENRLNRDGQSDRFPMGAMLPERCEDFHEKASG